MRVPKTPVDPPKVAGLQPAAGLREQELALVGRVERLRQHARPSRRSCAPAPAARSRCRTTAACSTTRPPGTELTGSRDNLWVGLSLLHSLFAREHNAICDMFKQAHADWSDERLFRQARLVNAALMAKIHTVEWTPAILPHPLLVLALNTNWDGVLPGLQKVFRDLADNDLLSGIPGSPTDHHTAPYSLTEEFASVYRMHSLMPDDFEIRSVKDGKLLGSFELPELSGPRRAAR